MPLHVVILAAGQGKRMRSALPKVLHRIAGRPLLAHVIDAARALKPERIYVVYGHGGAEVRGAFAGVGVDWVEQARRLGTGHALMQALPKIPRTATVLVNSGLGMRPILAATREPRRGSGRRGRRAGAWPRP